MTKEQEILKRINICLYQLAESIENGDIEMSFIKKNTDDIDRLIDKLI